jgi:DNA-binding response OmpR family regulator
MHAPDPGGASTVLVVDDDQAIRLLCRVNLELGGYRVLEAETLAQARDALATGGVALVLLDVHVGLGDGRAFLRDLREDGNRVPVALFTGSSEVDEQYRRLADGVVPKPFALEELTATVERLVARVDSAA